MQQPIFWILWGSMLASLGVYAALPALLPAPEEPVALSLPLVGGLLVGAVVVGPTSVVLRHALLVRPARSGQLDIGSAEGRARWLQVSVALWAMSESVGIAGLVLWILYRQPGLLYPFLAGAALLLVVHAPRSASLLSSRDLARPDVRIG